MRTNLTGKIGRLILAGFELAFVSALVILRIMNIGWILVIFGLLLVVWLLFHLGLMTAFIVGMKLSPIDLVLFLALHFFYFSAWLFQVDGGDTGGLRWTVEVLFDNVSFAAFLQNWGDTLFLFAVAATFACYLLIGILLIVRLVRWRRAHRQSRQPA